jgi:aspartyl/asparaginyl-tRNA synthetase
MDPLGSFLNQGFLNGLYKKWHEMDKAMLFSDLKKAFMESPEFKEMSEREKKPIMTVDYEKLVSIFKSSGLDFQKVTEETKARHEQLLGTKMRGKITGNTYVIIGITKADSEVDEDE